MRKKAVLRGWGSWKTISETHRLLERWEHYAKLARCKRYFGIFPWHNLLFSDKFEGSQNQTTNSRMICVYFWAMKALHVGSWKYLYWYWKTLTQIFKKKWNCELVYWLFDIVNSSSFSFMFICLFIYHHYFFSFKFKSHLDFFYICKTNH